MSESKLVKAALDAVQKSKEKDERTAAMSESEKKAQIAKNVASIRERSVKEAERAEAAAATARAAAEAERSKTRAERYNPLPKTDESIEAEAKADELLAISRQRVRDRLKANETYSKLRKPDEN